MNIFLWVLQGFLAVHTAMGGVWKFSNSEQTVPALKSIPHGIWLALGVLELVCGIGLVLPAFHGPLAQFVAIAAGCIGAEMLVFSAIHLVGRAENRGLVAYWLVVACLCAFIAYGRIALVPH